MRILAVAESPPTTDPIQGNGSTLISAEVISRLPNDVDVALVYFRDRDAAPDDRVVQRVRALRSLPLRPAWAGWASIPLTKRPRATWLRTAPMDALLSWSGGVDLVYLHGLHVAPLARDAGVPVVVNEVDPWSDYWNERGKSSGRLRGSYDRLQARRAAHLEREVARWGACTVVVNRADSLRLSARTGGEVVAIENGVMTRPVLDGVAGSRQVAFVGTLDYPPNVEALRRLVGEVWPLVQQAVPTSRLVVAGRRPTPEVLAMQSPSIDVRGTVEDVTEVFARSAAAAYVGVTGRGTKNTVAEAIAAGCPVVASPESARGHLLGEHLVVAERVQDLADLLVGLLSDGERRDAAARSAAAAAAEANSWDVVAQTYAALMRRCAGVA